MLVTVLLAVAPALVMGSGCQFWITPVPPKGSPPLPGKTEYYDCTGISSLEECGSVDCTPEGYAAKGCKQIDESAYSCLVAKERPESYGYLVSNPASCPGLEALLPKPPAAAHRRRLLLKRI